jgi:hypothetical protein
MAPEAVSLSREEAPAREIPVPDAVAAAVEARSVVAVAVSRPREEGGARVVPRSVEAALSAAVAVADRAIAVVPAMQRGWLMLPRCGPTFIRATGPR